MRKLKKMLRPLCVLIAAALLISRPAAASEPQWLIYASRLANAGLIDGAVMDFRPDDNLTLAEAAVMLQRIVKYPDKLGRSFSDLTPGTEAADAILAMAFAGVVYVPLQGDKCDPDSFVSRQEAVNMLYRVFMMEPAAASPGWSDYGAVVYTEAVNTFYAKGYIPQSMQVGNSFSPNMAVTRGQFAAMLCSVVTLFADSEAAPSATVTGIVVGAKLPKGLTVKGTVYLTSGSGGSSGNVVYINSELREYALNNADYSQLIGSCTTYFEAGSTGRNTNIQMAADHYISGTILGPGDTFSFNKTVGVRSYERGFREATIYVGNEKAKGIGGGICQASSTIFVAALNAGMTITERHQHSMTVSYIDPGLDATVSYGVLDMKFKNEIGVPVKITTKTDVESGVLTVSLWAPAYYAKPATKVGASQKGEVYYGYRYIDGKLQWYAKSRYATASES